MHELSLATAIVELVVRHAAGRRVRVVNARVGALRQVVPRSLEFQFGFAARSTVCEGARLEQVLIGALLACEECGRRWDPAPPPAGTAEALILSFRCPACGSPRFQVLQGEELEVDSIEVAAGADPGQAAEEERCTAPR